ncbi:MAG: hypothetical protein AAGL10_05565 [Pseudomonadota bacterium]
MPHTLFEKIWSMHRVAAAGETGDALGGLAGQEVMLDLAAQTVSGGGHTYAFTIEAEAKRMLAEGLDAIDLTLTQGAAIADWLRTDWLRRAWIHEGISA